MAAELAPTDVAEKMTEAEDLVLSLQRDINLLTDENRTARKRAISKIRQQTVDKKSEVDERVLSHVFAILLKPLLKLFADPTEKCREDATNLVRDFGLRVDTLEKHLPYISPTVVARLGQPEITEPSEEIRLITVEMLVDLAKSKGPVFDLYVGDICRVLCRTLIDPFPEVKKASCELVTVIGKASPQLFHYEAHTLVAPLLASMNHAHSRVRQASLKALGVVVKALKSPDWDTILPVLVKSNLDQQGATRKMLVDVVGHWLLELVDRYSFGSKLLPFVLASFHDEIADVASKAREMMDRIGAQYEAENEEDIKDQKDFDASANDGSGGRPRIGARLFVQRHLHAMLPGVLNDLGDWTVGPRRLASDLLHMLLVHCEGHVTQHLEKLLPGLFKASQDDVLEIQEQISATCILVGRWVHTPTVFKLILPHLKGISSESPAYRSSVLCVLKDIIKGAGCAERLEPELPKLLKALSQESMCHSEHTFLLEQLILVLTSLVAVAGTALKAHTQAFFFISINLVSMADQPNIVAHAKRLMTDLAAAVETPPSELYRAHIGSMLSELAKTATQWSRHSSDRNLLRAVVVESKEVAIENIDSIVDILVGISDPKVDPDVRLDGLTLLIHTAGQAEKKKSDGGVSVLVPHAHVILSRAIFPNLVWRGGKTAEAIRAAATLCLLRLCEYELITVDVLTAVLPEFITRAVSALEDQKATTRMCVTTLLGTLFRQHPGVFEPDVLHKFYPELLKRLDDSDDAIRIEVATTLMYYANLMDPVTYDVGLYQAHLEHIYKTLLLHLDDSAPDIQQAVYKVLVVAGRVAPSMVRDEVGRVRHKHRSPKLCDDLLVALSE